MKWNIFSITLHYIFLFLLNVEQSALSSIFFFFSSLFFYRPNLFSWISYKCHIWLGVYTSDDGTAGFHCPPIYRSPLYCEPDSAKELCRSNKYIYFLIVYLSLSRDLWTSYRKAKEEKPWTMIPVKALTHFKLGSGC